MITEKLPSELKKCFVEELMQLVKKYNTFEEYESQQIDIALKLIGKIEMELSQRVQIIYSRYSEEFKTTIIELYENAKSISELSSEYGIAKSTVGGWVKLNTPIISDSE